MLLEMGLRSLEMRIALSGLSVLEVVGVLDNKTTTIKKVDETNTEAGRAEVRR